MLPVTGEGCTHPTHFSWPETSPHSASNGHRPSPECARKDSDPMPCPERTMKINTGFSMTLQSLKNQWQIKLHKPRGERSRMVNAGKRSNQLFSSTSKVQCYLSLQPVQKQRHRQDQTNAGFIPMSLGVQGPFFQKFDNY